MRITSAIALAALLLGSGAQVCAGEASERLLAEKTAVLRSLHKKAKKALVNAAQDRTFEQYFTTHDDGHRHALKTHIDRISLSVQDRFAVEEMCLIDPAGSEISRIVGDRIAHDLSQDEARASFFSPGFDTPRRNVYVSPAYISADVDKWVVAYVTPVVVADKKRAILHYEHGLDIYQKLLNRDLEGTASYVLAVDADGYVVSDSRRVMSVARRADGDGRSAYFETFSFAGLDLASFRQQVDAGAALTNVTGGPVDAAYSVVEDWTLIAVIDTSQAMAAQ